MHRNTGRTQPVIVEYGFIDDTPDKVKYLQDNYKQLAEAVIKAIAEYAGYKYTSPFAVSDETYTVKAGDSLYAISKKLKVNKKKIVVLVKKIGKRSIVGTST